MNYVNIVNQQNPFKTQSNIRNRELNDQDSESGLSSEILILIISRVIDGCLR